MQVCILLPPDNHTSTPLLSFFTGRMPFLPPNQQRQSTEGNSTQVNDYELCDLLDLIQQKFPIPKLIVGDFNFANISWYDADGCGVIARCTDITQIGNKFINTLNKNFFIQHVSEPTRQRGLDVPHTPDLIISSDSCLSEIEHLSPLGMSDHSVLMFRYEWAIYIRKQISVRQRS